MRVGLNEESQARWNADGAESRRYDYDLIPGDVVFDVGAYRGDFAAEIYRRYQCKIVGIEPTPHNAFEHYERFVNKAASDHDGTLAFAGAYYYTSACETGPATVYPCFDINSLIAEYPEIALFKCNIEGLEFGLMAHILSANLHLRIRNLQIQFHLIEGADVQKEYDLIATELQKSHTIEWSYPFCWESWRRK